MLSQSNTKVKQMAGLRIALVHDWILGVGGAEKTLKALHKIFPQAPIYTLFYNKKFTDEFLPEAEIRSTFLQKTYEIFGSHKLLTPLMPLAVESIDLSDFDLVISSSVSFSKGLILKPQTRHICYCYSPMRQVWDWHAEYKTASRMPGLAASLSQHFLRIWDRQASTRVDDYVAISENVRRRIKKYYNRDSTVIYPPVARLSAVSPDLQSRILDSTSLNRDYQPSAQEKYFLIVSRLYKHKNIDIAVKAFNKLEWPLVIIGNGPDFKRLKKIAGPTVQMLGYQPDTAICGYYANCRAFIMPQEEDFGIAPIEAMSCGKPVLALARGGALEYVEEGTNGEFFEDPAEEVLADGARRLAQNLPEYQPEKIKKTAERFYEERFALEIENFVGKITRNPADA